MKPGDRRWSTADGVLRRVQVRMIGTDGAPIVEAMSGAMLRVDALDLYDSRLEAVDAMLAAGIAVDDTATIRHAEGGVCWATFWRGGRELIAVEVVRAAMGWTRTQVVIANAPVSVRLDDLAPSYRAALENALARLFELRVDRRITSSCYAVIARDVHAEVGRGLVEPRRVSDVGDELGRRAIFSVGDTTPTAIVEWPLEGDCD